MINDELWLHFVVFIDRFALSRCHNNNTNDMANINVKGIVN